MNPPSLTFQMRGRGRGRFVPNSNANLLSQQLVGNQNVSDQAQLRFTVKDVKKRGRGASRGRGRGRGQVGQKGSRGRGARSGSCQSTSQPYPSTAKQESSQLWSNNFQPLDIQANLPRPPMCSESSNPTRSVSVYTPSFQSLSTSFPSNQTYSENQSALGNTYMLSPNESSRLDNLNEGNNGQTLPQGRDDMMNSQFSSAGSSAALEANMDSNRFAELHSKMKSLFSANAASFASLNPQYGSPGQDNSLQAEMPEWMPTSNMEASSQPPLPLESYSEKNDQPAPPAESSASFIVYRLAKSFH